eukprot:CAMPEP_0119311730 /NCGR_PEP_ID=MMETSP1333-20130426/23683_1 /TAXON_ID=418940 /ORGANISM="Scyphosphaera apsteinii, Strain RCC1455" /LENGTH=736 /DNA_ID=CAMNT_0007316199 /DNA_START=155 /DNA_END=2365 /DNA_ORIENTATION=+
MSREGKHTRYMLGTMEALYFPQGIACDDKAVYVSLHRSVEKFSYPDGTRLAAHKGDKSNCFEYCSMIDGVLYAVDSRVPEILVFDKQRMIPQRKWGEKFPYPDVNDWAQPILDPPTTHFIHPVHIASHPVGVMVTDDVAWRVVRFTNDGIPVGTPIKGEHCPHATAFFNEHILLVEAGQLVVIKEDGSLLQKIRFDQPKMPQPFLPTLFCDEQAVYVIETLPRACVHKLELADPVKVLVESESISPIELEQVEIKPFDLCIIGGGMVGCCTARDVASCNFKIVLVEKEPVIGGVWAKNKYPGLRLHAPGTTYRCLSVAPKWQTSVKSSPKEGPDMTGLSYRPTQDEILQYIESLTEHPNIQVRLGSVFCHAEEMSPVMQRVICDTFTFKARTLFYANGAYEVTSGKPYMPIDVTEITNGAAVFHSSEMTSRKGEWDSATTRYIIGASKAAIDVLQTLDPGDESIVWAHRGHVIFMNRDRAFLDGVGVADKDESQKKSEQKIAGTNTMNHALKNQHFQAYDSMILGSKMGHRIGTPYHKGSIGARGGVESEAGIEHARAFLPRQRIVKMLKVADGQLMLELTDGKILIPGANDTVVMCTGQRNNMGPMYHSKCGEMNFGGTFRVLPFSGTAPMISIYFTSLIVAHLDQRPNPYSSGLLYEELTKLGEHMDKLQNRQPWAMFMSFLGGLQLDICNHIFPWVNIGAGDLSFATIWWTDWFGKDLDVRQTTIKLSTKPKE